MKYLYTGNSTYVELDRLQRCLALKYNDHVQQYTCKVRDGVLRSNLRVSPTAPNDFEAFTEILTFRGTTVLFCVNIDSSKLKKVVLLNGADH